MGFDISDTEKSQMLAVRGAGKTIVIYEIRYHASTVRRAVKGMLLPNLAKAYNPRPFHSADSLPCGCG
jgi:hypothetical protein